LTPGEGWAAVEPESIQWVDCDRHRKKVDRAVDTQVVNVNANMDMNMDMDMDMVLVVNWDGVWELISAGLPAMPVQISSSATSVASG
jgi:hypothetical protein